MLHLLNTNINCPYLEFFWSECEKMRTRKTPNTNTFYAVRTLKKVKHARIQLFNDLNFPVYSEVPTSRERANSEFYYNPPPIFDFLWKNNSPVYYRPSFYKFIWNTKSSCKIIVYELIWTDVSILYTLKILENHMKFFLRFTRGKKLKHWLKIG